jgi:aspartyl-tRNA(Asn)/glutamyl-tRNA(Gln) amidotransferase subunit C
VDVTEDLVRHVARLARLALEEDEVPALAKDLARILEHVEAVQGVATDEGAPAAAVPPVAVATLRADETRPPLPRETVLSNAPEQDEVFFLVPRVLGAPDATPAS